MAKLTKTSTPGIFRAHRKVCDGHGRCSCPYVVVHRHRGKQHKTSYPTFGEAREAKGQRDAGESRPTAKTRLGDYYAAWIKAYAGRTAAGFAETSRVEYKRAIETYALPKWGTWKLSDMDPVETRNLFLELRKSGKSTSEIKKLRAATSAMFATAVEDGALPSNPVRDVRIPAALEGEEPDEDRAKALTREDLGLLLAALPERWRLFFELLTHSELRIGEAIALTWDHLELTGDAPQINVREQIYRGKRRKLKTRAARRQIPLSPGMARRLLAHRRDSYLGPKSPVFTSTGKLRTTERGEPFPLSPQNFARDVLHPVREAIGMDWVTFHTFRHTCASLLFEKGRNIKQVSEWLGHTDPSFTLRTYVHLMDGGIGDATFFDEAVSPAGGNTRATEGTDIAARATPVDSTKMALQNENPEHPYRATNADANL